MQHTGLREKLKHAGNLHWVHWCVVSFSLILTLGAWYISKTQVEEKTKERFARESQQVVDLVVERMGLYENVLWGAVAYLHASKSDISFAQWHTYAQSLHIDVSYPGINGIGVIYNVEKEDFAAYLSEEQKIRPDYRVHPEHEQKEYWPITYIDPVAANKKAVGLDMAFENNRYTGILRARDSGKGILTGPIVLVQDSKKTPGFLFYTPFYKNGVVPETLEERQDNIIGVTYAPFIMYKLMKGTLERDNRNVGIKISDEGDILFDDHENSGELGALENAQFTKETSISLYGRTWDFSIWSDDGFNKASKNNQPMMILIGGIIIDSLLLSLFIFLTRANRKALAYADKMTEDLQVESRRLEKSNNDLEQFAYVASHDLKAPLRGMSNIAKWLDEDLQGVLQGQEEFTDQLKETTTAYIAQLFKRANRLESLLESILAYSRAGEKTHSVETIDVQKSVDDIKLLLNVDEAFRITNDPLPNIQAERTPFEIVLRNVISNAMKHHDKAEGHIHISSREDGACYEFSVTDDGPGVEEGFREKIFELFTTLRARDDVEGSGMGLATIRKILEEKDCRIWYAGDADPRGSVFKFTWPKSEEVSHVES